MLGPGLAHGRFRAVIDVSAETLPLLFRRDGDPIEIERSLRPLDLSVAGVSREPRPALGENEVIAGADALSQALGDELAGDVYLGRAEHAGARDQRAHAAHVVGHDAVPPIEPVAMVGFSFGASVKGRRHLP